MPMIEEYMGRLEQNWEGLQELLNYEPGCGGVRAGDERQSARGGGVLISPAVTAVTTEPGYLARLKQVGAHLGRQFKGREFRIIMPDSSAA